MISTDGGITERLLPLNAEQFNCFDPIDEEDTDTDFVQPKKAAKKTKKAAPVFDETGYGSDTFVKPEPDGKKVAAKPKTAKMKKTLPEYVTVERRIELLTRQYEPTDFDNNTMIFRNGTADPRPQWVPPKASNDNQKRKHSSPAVDEARNNSLMVGRNSADTLLQNEWAFDILLEVADLLDAAAPTSAWLQHDGHGETDEHEPGDSVNSGYGPDLIHDYGPSEDKVKKLWEHGNDNEPSKNGDPWNRGTVEKLNDVLSEPTHTLVKTLIRSVL
jgi:hypothetical protein